MHHLVVDRDADGVAVWPSLPGHADERGDATAAPDQFLGHPVEVTGSDPGRQRIAHQVEHVGHQSTCPAHPLHLAP
jgi:hypothetical protein